jgi:hypothetical protein
LLFFTPRPQYLLLPPLLCPFALHRRPKEQRKNSAADLLYSGADARRRPSFSSTTPPPPPLLSATLQGDWILFCTLADASSPPLELR